MGLILQPVHSLSANSQRSSQRTEQLSVHAKTAAITEACCYQGLSRMEAEEGSDKGMAAAVFSQSLAGRGRECQVSRSGNSCSGRVDSQLTMPLRL